MCIDIGKAGISAVEIDHFHQVVGLALKLCLCALPPTTTYTKLDSVGSHGSVSICVCIFETVTAGG